MLSNVEDGAQSNQSCLSVTGCVFENNGAGGSGDGMRSMHDLSLVLKNCVFAYHNAEKGSAGLHFEVGASGSQKEGTRDGASRGSQDVIANGSSAGGLSTFGLKSNSSAGGGTSANTVTSCQFIANAIGCHVTLSAEADAPPIIACAFFRNTKAGQLFHAAFSSSTR